ncbi:MAG: twin-arginine translocase subunit TatC [Desulfovibrio sp.]|jgi:sec-independent protein translocase protein TatC|nr:twin-arginine translocase subunit TatC [Desulfovibrio sp.]
MNAGDTAHVSSRALPAKEPSDSPQDDAREGLPSPARLTSSSCTKHGENHEPVSTDDSDYLHPGLAASLEASLRYARHGLSPDEDNGASPQADDAAAVTPPEDNAAESSDVPTLNSSDAKLSPAFGAKPDARDSDNEKEEEEEEDYGLGRPMSLREHLKELRKRVFKAFLLSIVGFIACYPFAQDIFSLLLTPLTKVLPNEGRLIYTSPPEAFFIYMKVAFMAGIFLTSPLIFYQIWAFVAPGLYKEEKIYILPIAFFSSLFFICGGLFCYFVTFPFAFEFFMSYSTDPIVAMPGLDETLSFVLHFLFAFGLVFELPLFVFFLSRLGIITADMMRKARRYAILANFIVAAVLTPPDVLSQLLMACPLILLYEISIIIAVVFGKKRTEQAVQADAVQNK